MSKLYIRLRDLAGGRSIKQAFQDAWAQSDDAKSLAHALDEKGYALAKGDRRGVVGIGLDGSVFAFSRFAGLKARDVQTKISDTDALPSVADRQGEIRRKLNAQALGYIAEIKAKHSRAIGPLDMRRAAIVKAQRAERCDLKAKQEARWIAETAARSARLNIGMRGLFDRLSGKAKTQRLANEKEAMTCARRDQTQRDDLILAQMKDRRELQHRYKLLRDGQARDRKTLGSGLVLVS